METLNTDSHESREAPSLKEKDPIKSSSCIGWLRRHSKKIIIGLLAALPAIGCDKGCQTSCNCTKKDGITCSYKTDKPEPKKPERNYE